MHLLQEHEVAPGRRRGRLPTGLEGVDLPVWTIQGGQPGPTLVLTAGVHGCEYVGILALRALFDQISPEKVKGRLLLLPLVNSDGFYAGVKRVVPGDGKNINRAFPARANGTVTERIAYAIQTQIYPEADFLLDLHGGDANEAMTPLIFYPADAEPSVRNTALLGAVHLEAGYRVPSTSRDGLYSCAARRGVPALLMEVGGQGLWSQEQVAMELRSIYSLMGALDMGGQAIPNDTQMEVLEASYDVAETEGLWFPEVFPGQRVAAGAVLGTVVSLDGELLQTIKVRWDGVVLYHTVALGVEKGEALVACGRLAGN